MAGVAEDEDQRALHARIFGDDDSDAEDEEYVAPVPEISGKKRLQKTKPSSSKKRRSAPDADTMAAEGARLEAESDAKRRKEGKKNDGEDPDDDSVNGEEAIEEGGKKDVDTMLGRKTRGGKKDYTRQECVDVTAEILDRMERAADQDEDAMQEEPPKPAVVKAKMMPEVTEFMRKRQYHETMIDNGFLSTLARWLKPTPDGSLVSLTVRTGLLKSLQLIEADDTLIGALRSSKIGVYIKLLSMHRKETDDNKRMAQSLVEKWSRPIFNSTVNFRSQEVEAVVPIYSATELAAQAEEMVKQVGGASADSEPTVHRSGMTKNGTAVPRPLGMDFHVQPANSVKATASDKYRKESIKGKLQDRFINNKKGKNVDSRHVTLSIEGRALDSVQKYH